MAAIEPAVAQGRRVVVCVSGGIAAYKAAEVVRALVRCGADVRVAMTPAATRFVGPDTFAALSGHRVLIDLFDASGEVAHVELARGAELAVVVPATADLLARMAYGHAGDAVAATLLTVTCPVLVAPAMHTEMWEHPATRANVDTLERRGVTFVGPERGELSSGDVGIGRMAEPDDIVTAALTLLARGQDLAGRRVVVTAGGTQEPIDPVRFIGNRSSGLMGYTIARAAARRGAKVTLVSGPTNLPPPPGVELVRVRTAEEMHDAVVAVAPDADVIVKAAAVADFRPQKSSPVKLKKAAGPPEVRLEPTVDILAELGAHPELRKPGGLLIGFAAETEADPEALARVAEDKRASKGADVVVANDVGSSDSGFNVPTNRAVIATARGTRDVGLVTKAALAEALIDEIAGLLAEA